MRCIVLEGARISLWRRDVGIPRTVSSLVKLLLKGF
jgi:hypothetical protein